MTTLCCSNSKRIKRDAREMMRQGNSRKKGRLLRWQLNKPKLQPLPRVASQHLPHLLKPLQGLPPLKVELSCKVQVVIDPMKVRKIRSLRRNFPIARTRKRRSLTSVTWTKC
jgi:hypothetical protein